MPLINNDAFNSVRNHYNDAVNTRNFESAYYQMKCGLSAALQLLRQAGDQHNEIVDAKNSQIKSLESEVTYLRGLVGNVNR